MATRRFPFLGPLLVALCLPLPAQAQTPEASRVHNQALAAFSARDYERARTLAQQACDGGVAQSCALLGMLLENAWGGPLDAEGALSYFRRACEGGVPTACAYLESRGESVTPAEPTVIVAPAAPAASRAPLRDLATVGFYGSAMQLQGAELKGDDALSLGWEVEFANLQSVPGTSLVWGLGLGYHQTPFLAYEGGRGQDLVSKGLTTRFLFGLRVPMGTTADLIFHGGAFAGMVETYSIDGEDTLEKLSFLGGHRGGLAGGAVRLGNVVVFGRYQYDLKPLFPAELDGEFERTGFQAGLGLVRVF